jgi:probable HAF family extracellular repeat protein
MQDLGTVAGDSGSFALSINDKGQVVGLSNDANGNLHAFLWQHGVMTDLNAIIPPSFPFVLVEAFDINARGEIVGLAVDPNTDEGHAFLAVPCDEGHADTKGCKDEGAVAVQSDTSERPKVTLSKRARKLLWQHIGGRYTVTPPAGMTTQTVAESAPEQPPSCPAQSSSRQSGAAAAASAVSGTMPLTP